MARDKAKPCELDQEKIIKKKKKKQMKCSLTFSYLTSVVEDRMGRIISWTQAQRGTVTAQGHTARWWRM